MVQAMRDRQQTKYILRGVRGSLRAPVKLRRLAMNSDLGLKSLLVEQPLLRPRKRQSKYQRLPLCREALPPPPPTVALPRNCPLSPAA